MVTHECIKSSCCVFIIKQKTALKHHLHSVCVVYAGMSVVETEIINKSKIKPHEWKRYIDDVFSLWDKTREEIDQFIVEANRHHPTIKFMAEISDKETNFLDTTIFKGERFLKDSILDISTHFKPTEKFQYTHLYTSCHVPGVKKGFIKGKSSGFLEPTLRRQDLKKIFVTLNQICASEATQTIW